MKINSKRELYDFLEILDWDAYKEHDWSSVYFLIKYDKYTQAVYFSYIRNSWFESSCVLRVFPLADDKLKEYVEEQYIKKSWDEAYKYESVFQKDNCHYEIDNPQCFPFLPEELEIVKIMTEKECLEWLIEKTTNK